MNALITVSCNDDNQTVLGRDLHLFLEVESNYTTWMKRMSEYGFTEGNDFIKIIKKSTGGRPANEFQLTIDMAKDICRKQRRSPKAAELYGYLEKYAGRKEVVYVGPSRPELSFGSVLAELTREFGYYFKTQYYINGFRVDFYFPEPKIAVEYDEFQHLNDKNIKKDLRRQKIIERELKCKFLRLDCRDSDIVNASKVLVELLNIKNKGGTNERNTSY